MAKPEEQVACAHCGSEYFVGTPPLRMFRLYHVALGLEVRCLVLPGWLKCLCCGEPITEEAKQGGSTPCGKG